MVVAKASLNRQCILLEVPVVVAKLRAEAEAVARTSYLVRL